MPKKKIKKRKARAKARKRKPGKVHPICQRCYNKQLLKMDGSGTREIVKLPFPWCGEEHCCWCGRDTNHGIYYRTTKSPECCNPRYETGRNGTGVWDCCTIRDDRQGRRIRDLASPHYYDGRKLKPNVKIVKRHMRLTYDW